jgi:hypothetical protein
MERRLIFLTGDASGTPAASDIAAQGIPVLPKSVRLEEVAREIRRLVADRDRGGAADDA